MIDVKEAVQIAIDYFNDLYEDQNYENLLPEEVEYDEDKDLWRITLGYSKTVGLEKSGITFNPRHYKVFEINAETGKVLSMKIRTLEHA
ncbi:MAG: hypothetical protein GVY18_06320 [Bacteroidetes bacterium]|nr:hypothetical protein [Bacteroidota bacterium]